MSKSHKGTASLRAPITPALPTRPVYAPTPNHWTQVTMAMPSQASVAQASSALCPRGSAQLKWDSPSPETGTREVQLGDIVA